MCIVVIEFRFTMGSTTSSRSILFMQEGRRAQGSGGNFGLFQAQGSMSFGLFCFGFFFSSPSFSAKKKYINLVSLKSFISF